MGKEIAVIPLGEIERVALYINTGRKTLAEIRAETGADYIINGGLYDMAKWRAVCHLKADGYTYAEDPYTYWGYGWDAGADISMQLVPAAARRNYIACVGLLRGGEHLGLQYPPELGGARPRSAMGLMGDKLCLYCTDGGVTPEGLRAELRGLGWESAVMLDGGGSAQCDFNGARITSSREVHNLILAYLKKKGEKPVGKKYTVCLDPGHGPDTVNGSPDGTYKEREFTWDMYTRLRPLLERHGISVVCTRSEGTKPGLTERAQVSNKAGADLLVSLHSNACAGTGWHDARGLLIYTAAAGANAGRNIAANAILDCMRASGVMLSGGGLLHNPYTVLTKTVAPAVLIEYGFHDNREDVDLLKDSGHRAKLAEATARGVCEYLGVAWTDTPPEAQGDRERVKERFGLDEYTMGFLGAYKYADALLAKLAAGK